jgi:tetratricopeptide (TPR) repeat protein
MSMRVMAASAARVGVLACVVIAGACAARTPPPPVMSAPRYPDFVFPAVNAGTDPATAERQDVAWRWLQAGDLRSAEREFTAILKRQPQFAPAESGLAYVLLARRQSDAALKRFTDTLSEAPAYAPALAGRGQALLALGRDAEALASLEAAAAADPSLDLGPRIEVLKFRGAQDRIAVAREAAARGRLDEARAAYQQALALSPDSAFLLRELASVEESAGDTANAIEHLQKAVALDPADAKSYALLGDLLAAKGDLDGAIRAYTAARELEDSPEIVAKLEAARKRRELARLPSQYAAIPGLAEVTRADVAAVLGVRLADVLAPAEDRQGVLVTDVRGHWAAPWVLAVVRAGVMEPLPNHTFQPQQRVRRVDFAVVATRVLGILSARRPGTGADWQSARVSIEDVPPGHPTYGAVSETVAAGVLPLEGSAFLPSRPLSGAELTAAVDRLEQLARPVAERR